MTAWAQSWSTDSTGREGVVPVTELELGGTPAIDAPNLARIVKGLEKYAALLGQVQTCGVDNADRRALLMRTEKVSRSLFAYSHTWIADLVHQHGLDGIYGSVPEALAVLLRLPLKQSGQRILMAEQFGERTAMTGERLQPHLPATTEAAEDGVLDEQHQQIIRKFFKKLGNKVDVETAQNAEIQLAQLARELLPDAFAVAARRLYDILDPDGELGNDEQIADQCYLTIDAQGDNGLSNGRFRVDAEFRAYLEAIFDKWAKPGMCNATDDVASPVVDCPVAYDVGSNDVGDGVEPDLFDETDEPDATVSDATDAERARRDRRGRGRRQHDAIKVVLRQMLASGQLGRHRGLPVTAVVTMTLKELETASGYAVTGTGSTVRMRDAIRMASHAHHYLVIFDDDGRALHLGRTKRIASADQRIVLMAADRGCTFPGCSRPATWSQVHHIDEWNNGGNTDIDRLTFGCDIHHPLVGDSDTQWATTKAGPEHPYPGRTLWHAPTAVDPLRRGTVNHFHHPGEYIYPSDVPLPGLEDCPSTGTAPDRSPKTISPYAVPPETIEPGEPPD